MSQPRTRKTPIVAAGNAPRQRAPVSKASGEPGPAASAQKPPQQKRSRNKIPKSIRYDLENALVGLCDVWFEEIKPHLVKNNIKLHVHGGVAGGDQRRLPPGAPGCAHLHPALSAPGCELCRLLFNAANGIESAVSQAASAAHSMPITPVVAVAAVPALTSLEAPGPANEPTVHRMNQNRRSRNRERRLRRKIRSSKSTSPKHSNWRVPRMCRTHIALSPPHTPLILRKINAANVSQPLQRDSLLQLHTKRKTGLKNKSTQTELLLSPPRGVNSQKRVFPSGFRRSPATITFLPPRVEKKKEYLNIKDARRAASPINTIFSKEFINVIGEKQEKKLEILFSRPVIEKCSSIMNLIQSPKKRSIGAGVAKKKPWR